MVVEESADFSSFVAGEADALGRAAELGPEGALGQALQVDGGLVLGAAQVAMQLAKRAGQRGEGIALPGAAGKDVQFVEQGVAHEEGGGAIFNEPADAGVGVGAAQGGQEGQAVQDVAQGAEADEEKGRVHANRRWSLSRRAGMGQGDGGRRMKAEG